MKKSNTGKLLISALKEALEYHEGKITLRTSALILPNDPKTLSASDIRKIREVLQLSQPVFAKYIGVSDKAVKSWEQGLSKPTGSAARLLNMAKFDHVEFQKLILNSSGATKSTKKSA